MVLRLRSGSVTPASLPRNRSAAVDVDQRDVEVAAEQVDHLLRLAVAQQAGVDEDAGELVADGLVDEQRRRRRESTPPERPQITPARAHLLAHARHGLRPVGLDRPVALQAGDPVGEVAQEVGADRRVDDLRVELHAVEAPLLVGDRGEGRGVAVRERARSRAAAPSPCRRGSSRPAPARPAPGCRRAAARPGRRPAWPGRTRAGPPARRRRRAARTWSARRSRCRAPARPAGTPPRAPAGSPQP